MSRKISYNNFVVEVRADGGAYVLRLREPHFWIREVGAGLAAISLEGEHAISKKSSSVDLWSGVASGAMEIINCLSSYRSGDVLVLIYPDRVVAQNQHINSYGKVISGERVFNYENQLTCFDIGSFYFKKDGAKG